MLQILLLCSYIQRHWGTLQKQNSIMLVLSARLRKPITLFDKKGLSLSPPLPKKVASKGQILISGTPLRIYSHSDKADNVTPA